jgi:hypothetical protein
MSVPHATNRYLNLLAFFARVAPQEISAWRATLDQATASRLTAVLDASAHRRPPRRKPNPWSMPLALLVSGSALAASGWLIFGPPAALSPPGTPNAAAAASMNTQDHPANVAGVANTPAPGNSGSPSDEAPTGAQTAAAARQLLARMPSGFARTCQPITVPASAAALGADAEVVCQPQTLASGGYVTYAHYRTHDAMQSVYAGLAHQVPPGDCTSGNGQGSYAQGSSQNAGEYACVAVTGQNDFAWTDNQLDILSVAASDRMTLDELYQWWLHGDTGPKHTPSAVG